MSREVFICNCHNAEHQIIFGYFDDEPEVYATVHLMKMPFFKRLWYGIRYIFGYQCKYGAFDEFVFNPDDAHKLDKIVEHLSLAKREATPEEEFQGNEHLKFLILHDNGTDDYTLYIRAAGRTISDFTLTKDHLEALKITIEKCLEL